MFPQQHVRRRLPLQSPSQVPYPRVQPAAATPRPLTTSFFPLRTYTDLTYHTVYLLIMFTVGLSQEGRDFCPSPPRLEQGLVSSGGLRGDSAVGTLGESSLSLG